MSDQEVRELERRARESGEPADQAALLLAQQRAGLLEPTRLRAQAYLGDPAARLALGPERPTRWDRLAPFVASWFSEPLAPDLEAAWANLVQLEERCGTFPEALREWLLLSHGRAGCDVAESAVLAPDFVVVQEGRLPVFCDRQGRWSYAVELEAGEEDPPVYLNASPEPLSSAAEVIWLGLLFGVAEAAAWDYPESSFSGLPGLSALQANRTRSPAQICERLEQVAGPLSPFDPWRAERMAQEFDLSDPPHFTLRAYLGEEVLVVTDDHPAGHGGWTYLTARSQEAFAEASAWLDLE